MGETLFFMTYGIEVVIPLETGEGPYCITSVVGIGAYYLEDLGEKVVPRPWNVHNLKRYYY